MAEAILVDSPQIRANEYVWAKNAADVLHRHYPNHLWGVNVEGSVMRIRDLLLDGRYGYTLHVPLVYSMSSFEKDIMRAGGEILERYNVQRGAVDVDSIIGLPTDFAGRHKPDMS